MPALAVLLELRRERLEAVDRPHGVDGEHPVENLVRGLVERGRARADPGIVADDVDLAEVVLDRVGDLIDLGTVGDVEQIGDGLDAEPADLVARLFEGREVDIGERDVDAVLREDARHAAPHAGRGTGDESGLAAEFLLVPCAFFTTKAALCLAARGTVAA